MGIPLALYRNPGPDPIEVSIGERPGDPPIVYRCEANGTMEGPANYSEVFVGRGLVLERKLEHAGRVPTKIERELGRENAELRAALEKATAEIERLTGENAELRAAGVGAKKQRGG